VRWLLHPLWPFARRGLTFVVIPAAAGLVLSWPLGALGIAAAFASIVVSWRRHQSSWTLASNVRTFRSAATPKVILHYSPLIRDPVLIRAFHRTVEMELHALSRQFGRPLRSPVVVYLFDQTQRVTRIFGPQYGAFALWDINAIILAADCPWEEFVRHELAHLFAGRWSKLAPPLLQEGLAVWLQGTRWGQPVNHVARQILGRRDHSLDVLLNREQFFSSEHMGACYALAGSLSGFLIRRFGWDKYSQLYRRCDGRLFRKKFQKCFGMSLEDAHWEWRLDLRLSDE